MSHPSDDIAANISILFATPTVDAEHQASVEAIVWAAKTLAEVIVANTPESADRVKALTAVRDACDRAVSASLLFSPVVPMPINPP